MTLSSDSTQPPERRGLFRAAAHVLSMPHGAVLALLDLEHGIYHATTPFGAEAWATLVNGEQLERRVKDSRWEEPSQEEGPVEQAGVVDYLLDRRLIEPLLQGDCAGD